MALTLPGKIINIDHYKDSTWREEFFTEHGTDYRVRIYRERLAFADAEEEQLLAEDKGGIPVAEISPGVFDPGKPAHIEFKLSDILLFGLDVPMNTFYEGVGVDMKAVTLADIAKFIIVSNEIVMGIANQRRILDYRLTNELISYEDYESELSKLMPVFAG